MGFYYCPYCRTRVEKASPKSRRQHGQGKKHVQMKVEYYQAVIRKKGVIACGPPGAVIPNALATPGLLMNMGVGKTSVVGQFAAPKLPAGLFKTTMANIAAIEEGTNPKAPATAAMHLKALPISNEPESDFVSAGQAGLQKLLELQKAQTT